MEHNHKQTPEYGELYIDAQDHPRDWSSSRNNQADRPLSAQMKMKTHFF